MIDINKLVAGRRASFIHFGVIDMVAKREGVTAPNWLQSAIVTRRGVFSGNVAGEETYTKHMLAQDESYESSGKSWFRHHADMAGIVLHKKTEKPYLCVLHPRTQKTEYFVDGTPATVEQYLAIKRFKKNQGHGVFAVYDLDKVQCQGYIAPEDFDGDIGD